MALIDHITFEIPSLDHLEYRILFMLNHGFYPYHGEDIPGIIDCTKIDSHYTCRTYEGIYLLACTTNQIYSVRSWEELYILFENVFRSSMAHYQHFQKGLHLSNQEYSLSRLIGEDKLSQYIRTYMIAEYPEEAKRLDQTRDASALAKRKLFNDRRIKSRDGSFIVYIDRLVDSLSGHLSEIKRVIDSLTLDGLLKIKNDRKRDDTQNRLVLEYESIFRHSSKMLYEITEFYNNSTISSNDLSGFMTPNGVIRFIPGAMLVQFQLHQKIVSISKDNVWVVTKAE